MKPIPINEAKKVATNYGYDQVMIYARKVGDGGGEHMITYGRDRAHCAAIGKAARFLQEKIMGWFDASR